MFEMQLEAVHRWLQRRRTKYAIGKLDARLRADIGFPEPDNGFPGIYDGITGPKERRKRQ